MTDSAKREEYGLISGGRLLRLPDQPRGWELQIASDPAFARERWAKRVKDARGCYLRDGKNGIYVCLPSSAADLIDAVVRRFSAGNLVAGARGEYVGALPDSYTTFYLTGVTEGEPPSKRLADAWRGTLERLSQDRRTGVVRLTAKIVQKYDELERERTRKELVQKLSRASADLVDGLAELRASAPELSEIDALLLEGKVRGAIADGIAAHSSGASVSARIEKLLRGGELS